MKDTVFWHWILHYDTKLSRE